MTKTIYKYVFHDTNTIQVTEAELTPLFVGIDPTTGWVAVWCELDPVGGEAETVTFRFVGTGHDVPEGTYVGSAITSPGPQGYVWHVYRTS